MGTSLFASSYRLYDIVYIIYSILQLTKLYLLLNYVRNYTFVIKDRYRFDLYINLKARPEKNIINFFHIKYQR